MRIAILGCGPAGLLAAHASSTYTDEVHVYSVKEKSQMPGAQYCHQAIPGITDPQADTYIKFRKVGTREGYAEKVYGDPQHPVSWDKFEDGSFHPAWSMKDVYDKLWGKYEHLVHEFRVEWDDVDRMVSATAFGDRPWDIIFSSIPRPHLCHGGHKFEKADVWIAPHCWRDVGEDEVVYNGEPNVPWYRSSSIFGHDSTEFARSGAGGAKKGMKPTGHNCNCFNGAITHIGRFGKWEKGVLITHAFQDAVKKLGEVYALQ